MEQMTGIVSKMKILQLTPYPLVRFNLTSAPSSRNCLISAHALNFLADVANDMQIAVSGHLNQRNQLVVKNYTVIGMPQIVQDVLYSSYPPRKVS